MADPRGLSGAVFQPTPVRDFIQDFQRQQQLTGQAISRAQKAQKDFFDTYALDIDEDKVPEPYLNTYLPQMDAYRNKSKDVFALKDADPTAYRQGLRELDTMRKQLRIGAGMARERYKTGTAYKQYLDKHGDKLTAEKRNELIQKAQDFLTPSQGFEFHEDGALYFGDRTAVERFDENVVLSEPIEPELGPYQRIAKRTGYNEQNFGMPTKEGATVFSNQKAGNYFAIERRRGSDEYQDYLVEAVREDTGQQDITREEAVELAADNPAYDQRAQEIFIEDARVNFQEGGSRAGRGGADGFEKLKSTTKTFRKDHIPFSDPKNKSRASLTLERGFYPPKSTTMFVDFGDGERAKGEVQAIYEALGGQLYADVIAQAEGPREVRQKRSVKLSDGDIGRLEGQLGLPVDKSLRDLMPEKVSPRGRRNIEEQLTKKETTSSEPKMSFPEWKKKNPNGDVAGYNSYKKQ